MRFEQRPYRAAVLPAGLRRARQSRGGVVMLDMQTSPRDGASRLGQAEHDDTLPARNSRLAPGDQHRRARSPLGRTAATRYEDSTCPISKWMRVLDALNWIAENAATGSRLSLVLRLEDVRHLRRANERPRGAGLLGSGRAGDDHRAAAQSAGHPRSGRRPRAVRKQGRAPRAVARAAASLSADFPSRCRTSR